MKMPNSSKEGYTNLLNSAKHSDIKYHSAKGLPLRSCIVRAIGKIDVIRLSEIVKSDHRA